MKKVIYSIAILMIFYSSATVAQEKKFSGWGMGMNTIELNPKIIIQFDAQLRSSNNLEKPEALILRPVLGYIINKTSTIGLGIASISSWKTIDDVRDRTDEFRLWQQLNVMKKYNTITIQHRFRIEERWLPVVGVQNGAFKKSGTLFSTRLRYFTRAMIPMKKTAQFSRGFYWALQNEFFFNATGTTNTNMKLFDQSRTYGGGGHRLNKSFDIELGYLYQYVEGRGSAYTSNNIIQLSTFLRL